MADATAFLSHSRRIADTGRHHEVLGAAGAKLVRQLDLGQRGAVEVPDACVDEQAHDARVGVGLDGVQGAPGEALKEGLRIFAVDVGKNAIDGLFRVERTQHVGDAGKLRHFAGGSSDNFVPCQRSAHRSAESTDRAAARQFLQAAGADRAYAVWGWLIQCGGPK